jgi:protein TonB
MGYQALLFCTDEKLARVVSQLFSELEFAVSPISDPFAAVKNLMAQHYDAIVIDCENEQSAYLMIKSARNSAFNQGSLAIGLVEGQAGVAKAYRMGANLVLTKPINVEAAKGTLRVARGLLRKGTESTAGAPGAAAANTTVAHSSVSSFAPTNQTVGANSAPNASHAHSQHRSAEESTETSAPPAGYPAFAKSEQTAALTPMKPWTSIGSTVPVAQVPATSTPISSPQAWTRPEASEPVAAKIEAPKPAATPIVSTPAKAQGAAAAAAPARIAAPSQPAYQEEPEEFAEDDGSAPQANFSAIGATIQSPSFSMDSEHAGGSGGGQKILIGAVAVLLLIGGYFGWTKFGQSNLVGAPVAAVPQAPSDAGASPSPSTPAQTSPAPASHSNTTPTPAGHATSSMQSSHAQAGPFSGAQSSTTQNPVPQNYGTPNSGAQNAGTSAYTTPAGSAKSVATQPIVAAVPSESPVTKTAPAPILVKPGTAPRTHAQTPNQIEEAAAQPPSALGVATPADSALSTVLTSAPPSTKPSLARVRISQGVSQGLLIKRVEPQYPRNALVTHTQGAVQIEATVDKEGHVVNPKVLSGSPLLASAAVEAVRQWRYKPYYLDGEPVEIQTQITINFKSQ